MNNKTSGLFIGLLVGLGISIAIFSSLTKDIDQKAYSRGVKDTLSGMWGEPKEKEISILKEKKDCDEKGGELLLEHTVMWNASDLGQGSTKWKWDLNGPISIRCTSPTPPDIFNYEIK